MKKVHLVIALIISGLYTTAQPVSYRLETVPEEVKKNASVITRFEEIIFEVTDIDRATLDVHKVITVVNENGKDALVFHEYIDKFRKLDDAEIRVLGSTGKQTARYRQKDFIVQASGEGLIEDGKDIFFRVPAPTYPVTVEFKYKVRFRGTLLYPSYFIQNPGEAIESSSYTARVSKEFDLRYKEKNIQLEPETGEDGKYKWYKWTVKNRPPFKYEEGSVMPYPYIMLAPNKFKFDDYTGDLSSWKSFGEWYAKLYEGRDMLPPDRVAFLKDMVKSAPDEKEKIRRIYEYLQKNFRYVSIQLGIGGLRPFSAEFTDQKKYGDCKALSNYMKAALKAVGINSYSAIINAGVNALPMDTDFPSKFSNHVILCVPLETDTVWLECTSNTNDFGVLGSFTENRYALLVTEDGGVVVPTPVSKADDNYFHVNTTIALQEDGSGTSTVDLTGSGEFNDIIRYIIDEKEDERKVFLVRYLGFKQPDDFMFKQKEQSPHYSTRIDMSIEKVPEFIAGNKMFINPRLYKLWGTKLPDTEDRKQDYYFNYPFKKTDTTIIKLPEGFVVDVFPKEKDLNCKYAAYKTRYWYDEDRKAVYSTVTLQLNQNKIPAPVFEEVKKFFDEVLMDDTQRIVIKKE